MFGGQTPRPVYLHKYHSGLFSAIVTSSMYIECFRFFPNIVCSSSPRIFTSFNFKFSCNEVLFVYFLLLYFACL